jgi:hypothetical protein
MTLALTLLTHGRAGVDGPAVMLNVRDASRSFPELLGFVTFPARRRLSPRRCRDQEPSEAA